MEIVRLSIEGNNLDILPKLLIKKLPHCHVFSNGSFHVLVNEKHYIRSEGLIMATIILNLSEISVVKIEVITGGGGTGFFDLEWHVENHRLKHIVTILNELCLSQGWLMGAIKKKVVEEFE